MKTALTLVVLGMVLVGASALKCYSCVNCEENTAQATDCSAINNVLSNVLDGLDSSLGNIGISRGEPACLKSVANGIVNKACGKDGACGGKEKIEASNGSVNYCCKDDLCNSASAPGSALALLLSPALLALIR